MVTMKMLMMLVVAAIFFCSHRQAIVAREVIVTVNDDGNKLEISPWDIPCYCPWPFMRPRPWCPPPRPRPPPPPRSPWDIPCYCPWPFMRPRPWCPPPRPRPPPPPHSPWDIPCYCPWPFPWPRPWCPPPRPRPPPPPPSCSPPPPPPRSPPPPPPSPPPPAPSTSCSASDKEKVKTCMFNTTSIDECCPTFQSILGTSCPCYKYAEDLDNQVLITLEAYCDVDSPCRGVLSPPPPPPKPSCSASDQEKVKTCMFNTTSIDECCPTFQSILGTSCPCYKYAEDLDNQVLITLESYCDVDSPCKGAQVIKLSKGE